MVLTQASFTESVVEQAALAWLESAGWLVKNGVKIGPGEPAAERGDYGQAGLSQRLRDALARLNPALPAEALEDAFRKLTHPEGPTLEARNRAVHRLFVDGVTVEYRTQDGRIRGAQARVIDFADADNNDWLAVNQFTVSENKHTRRPDVVLFVNGLPLALIELKNAADENATIWTAFQQLQTYKAEVPSLFAFNDLLAVSDGVEARVGTFTAGREWFKPWRTVSGEHLADPHLMFGRHAPPLRLNIKKVGAFVKGVYGLGALLAPLNQLNSKPKLSILRWQCRARRWSRASALMCTVNLKGADLSARTPRRAQRSLSPSHRRSYTMYWSDAGRSSARGVEVGRSHRRGSRARHTGV